MKEAVRVLARSPIAGVLITLVAMMGYWSGNQSCVSGSKASGPLCWRRYSAALLVTSLLRLLCGNWARTGIAATMTAFYFFYIPALLSPFKVPFVAVAALHLAMIVVLFVLYRRLPPDEAKLVRVHGQMNLMCGLVLALNAVPLVFQQVRLEQQRSLRQTFLMSDYGSALAHASMAYGSSAPAQRYEFTT